MNRDQIVRASSLLRDEPDLVLLERPRNFTIDEIARILRPIKERVFAAYDPSSTWSKQIDLLTVDFWEPYTNARTTSDKHIVTIDVRTIQFVALLNEALVCGEDADKQERNLQVASVLYHHALQISPPNERLGLHALGTFPDPPKNLTESPLAGLLTAVHAMFILAHEIAHIARGHLNAGPFRGSRPDHGPGYIKQFRMFSEVIDEAEYEIEADSMAIMCCIAALVADDDGNLSDVLRATLQLSRYLLWLDMIVTPSPKRMAVARHYALQHFLRSMDGFIDANLVSDELAWLDENAEHGWCTAMEKYRLFHI